MSALAERWPAVAFLSYKPASPGSREVNAAVPGGLAGRRERNRYGQPVSLRRAMRALLPYSALACLRHAGWSARRGCAARPAASRRGTLGAEIGRAGRHAAATPASPAAAEQHRLPPDSTTKQTLALPGRTLAFTATAGSIRLFDDKGEPQADIAYTAYQLDGADPRAAGR